VGHFPFGENKLRLLAIVGSLTLAGAAVFLAGFLIMMLSPRRWDYVYVSAGPFAFVADAIQNIAASRRPVGTRDEELRRLEWVSRFHSATHRRASAVWPKPNPPYTKVFVHCMDPRKPKHLTDGLGRDTYTISSAGGALDGVGLESVRLAVAHESVRLLILGGEHTDCAAIKMLNGVAAADFPILCSRLAKHDSKYNDSEWAVIADRFVQRLVLEEKRIYVVTAAFDTNSGELRLQRVPEEHFPPSR